jgi:RNA polymerase sigma-70 factor (sigma-E family)
MVAVELHSPPEPLVPAWGLFDPASHAAHAPSAHAASAHAASAHAASAHAASAHAASETFEAALIELYHQHAGVLVQMLWVFVGDRAEAEDLTQEAFLRLQRAWTRLDQDQNLGGYLRATAFNLARSGFRRRRVRLRHLSPEARDVASAEDDAMLSDDQAEVLAAVRLLPGRQRQCVVLRYWDDLSDREIAATLGLSVNSVKTHLRRGLAKVEQRLEVRS